MMKQLLSALILIVFFCPSPAQTKQYTLSGYLSDAISGEKLINANVYEASELRGAISNLYGFYSLTLPAGTYDIVFSYVGFQPQKMTVVLNEDKKINAELQYVEALDEVTVVGGAVTNKLTDSQMSKEVLTMETIKSLPSFMGEADVMKTLQLMPGVQSGSEASSGIYVRGGGPDQNLILLDGVPVYNANHLFGFFSVFNTDAVKNVSMYKGGFPARFGGRLSSVVDIRMKEGNEKEYHGGVQVGLIASKFFVEGPLKKDKTAFHLSARRTYIDVLSQPFLSSENQGGYFFYDINAKINHKFSDKSRIYLSAYTGRDKAYSQYEDTYSEYGDTNNSQKTTDKSNLHWGNITTALRWNYIFNNKLFCNATFTYSKYQFKVENKSQSFVNSSLNESTFYNYKSGIDDWSSKFEFDWYPGYAHEIKFGFNYSYHTFRPGVETIESTDDEVNNINKKFGDTNTYAHEMNLFFEDNIQLTERLKANMGLHLSAFNVENRWYGSIEPRVSMRYLLSDRFTMKAGYSKMKQYLHLLSNSTIGLPTDLWLPVTRRIKPQASQQLVLGVVYSPSPQYAFSLETFYKTMDNLIEYKEGASFFGSSAGWEDLVEMGEGRSYGAELMLKKETGKTTGWIGYTLSKTERQFDHINFGQWFPVRYDRRHDASIVLSHKLSDKIDVGATWVFGTGNAVTMATHNVARLDQPEYTYPYLESRNNYRMPNYHRMDAGISFHKKKKRGTRTWKVSVYNLYNRKNPFFLYLSDKDNGAKSLKQISLFPILPSISYSYKF